MIKNPCEDCKYVTVYEVLDDIMEPNGELIYICTLTDDEVTPDKTTCDEFDERPLF